MSSDVISIANSSRSLVATFVPHGASLTSLAYTPAPNAQSFDVILGFTDPAAYASSIINDKTHGCIVGRVANRIGNASFPLPTVDTDAPVTIAIEPNLGPHHLHGSWRYEEWEVIDQSTNYVVFCYVSPDGDEGFPCQLRAFVKYEVLDDGSLVLDYDIRNEGGSEICDVTPVNLTNHSYFDLSGSCGRSDISDHLLMISAQNRTVLDENSIPTGEVRDVADENEEPSPIHSSKYYDFRTERPLGATDYDINFTLNHSRPRHITPITTPSPVFTEPLFDLSPDARLTCPQSRLCLNLWTTRPGIQLYNSVFLEQDPDVPAPTKCGNPYGKYAGVCLETQCWPDAVHHCAEEGWPSVWLREGEELRERTVWKFEMRDDL